MMQQDQQPKPGVQGSGMPKSGMMDRWQKIARRIRVPLGFLTAALYLFELWRHAPRPGGIALSLILVLPGLWLRGYAAGYVKKNRELTQTGPYAYTRNPLYLGSILIAAGFAVALLSWPVAAMLAAMFLIVYVPVIASEERFLRSNFADFDEYCQRVPRLIPRLTAPRTVACKTEVSSGKFSFDLYLRHREYNAAIGAALLYLSLLFLRPALGLFVRVAH
jgi:protein-S-isoprenylcysteine O-methyltransferase Ste14